MENFGIGVDIESIDRFNDLADGKQKRLLNKIFTKKEIKYCFSKTNPTPHLAARYAGKESVFKAISSSFDYNLQYKEIEIINNEYGAPYVMIKKKLYQDFVIEISLSHNKDFAIAYAIIQKKNKVIN
jgi:holo-[acyl-carrier protein] synthase